MSKITVDVNVVRDAGFEEQKHPRERGKFVTKGSAATTAQTLSNSLMNIHNAAAEEHKKAFTTVGARMWRLDNAHRLKEDQRAVIEQIMKDYVQRKHPEYIKEVFGALPFPLTVLNSYPNVSQKQRKDLERQVKKIHDHHQNLWNQELSKHIFKQQ